MKQFLLKLFTWWNGQTFGTQVWTWRFGEAVGQDEQGNRYFRTKGGKIDPSLGFERLGDLQRLRRGLAGAAVMAWLAASYRRRAAERRDLQAAGLGKAASPQSDRDISGLPALRLDPGERPPPQGHRRLPAVDAGKISIVSLSFPDVQLHIVDAPSVGNFRPEATEPESRAATSGLRVRASCAPE